MSRKPFKMPEQNHASFQEGITIKIVAVGFILTVLLAVLILNFVWSQQNYGRSIADASELAQLQLARQGQKGIIVSVNTESHYCCFTNSEQRTSKKSQLFVPLGATTEEINILCALHKSSDFPTYSGFDNRCEP